MSLMQMIDRQIESLAERIKEHSSYQDFLENYSNFEEWQQDLIKYAMLAFALLLPLLICSIFMGLYFSAKSELEIYQKIINTSNQIIQLDKSFKSYNRIVGRSPITNTNILEGKLGQLGVDRSKLKLQPDSFNYIEDTASTVAIIEFNELSSEELYSLLKRMTINQKMKLQEINIQKSEESNLLQGYVDILYLAQRRESSE